MRPSLAFFAASIAVAACSSSSSEGGTTDGGSDATTDATSDSTTGDAPIDGGRCWDEAGNWIFDDKSCGSDADCTTATHRTTCCSTEIVGVAKSKLADFTTCEGSWSAQFPACDCPATQPTAEDGKTIEAGTAVVHCTNFTSSGGVCMTTAP
jgi:hypothetical protein